MGGVAKLGIREPCIGIDGRMSTKNRWISEASVDGNKARGQATMDMRVRGMIIAEAVIAAGGALQETDCWQRGT